MRLRVRGWWLPVPFLFINSGMVTRTGNGLLLLYAFNTGLIMQSGGLLHQKSNTG